MGKRRNSSPFDNELNKIVELGLEEDCAYLRKSGLSYKDITSELNNSGKVPLECVLTEKQVIEFLTIELPKAEQRVARRQRNAVTEIVKTNLDIVKETTSLYGKCKNLMDSLEERAENANTCIDPYRFKAVASEMRELLKQMTDIQKEINDYDNIRKFMDIVISVVQEEAPDCIPAIAEKLRISKGTQWFADIVNHRM
jgi:DNA repair ATPase RecN